VVYRRYAYPAPLSPGVWLQVLNDDRGSPPPVVEEIKKRVKNNAMRVLSLKDQGKLVYPSGQRLAASIILMLAKEKIYPGFYESPTRSLYLSSGFHTIRVSDHPPINERKDTIIDIRLTPDIDIEAAAREAADALIRVTHVKKTGEA